MRRSTKVAVSFVVVPALVVGGLVAVDRLDLHHGAEPAAAATATSLADVTKQRASSRISLDATLGYSGTYDIMNQRKGTYTWLPAVGDVIEHGGIVSRVDGEPVVLLSGSVPAYRSLTKGMSGDDVTELNAELVALGYATRSQLDPASKTFTAATVTALEKLQAHLGTDQTGRLDLGQAVFLPEAIRVTSVKGTLGASVAPTPVLTATSTTRDVEIALDPVQQGRVKVGDAVTVTLPDDRKVDGEIRSVGTVATQKAAADGGGSGGGSGSDKDSTIEVHVSLKDPAATGSVDQAPVKVAVTTQTVDDALTVPVTALLALAGGGYGVEVVGADGVHHLVGVELGVFDDTSGRVQVTGSGIEAGQHVVVPGS